MYDYDFFEEYDESYENEYSNSAIDDEFNESRSSRNYPGARSTNKDRDHRNTSLYSWEENSLKSKEDQNSLDDLYSRITQKQSHQEVLPNGYTRKDFHGAGYSDDDIEFWGLDKPGAPDPIIAGYIIADLFDGNLDGNFSWPFNM